jgi:hypothetical protein
VIYAGRHRQRAARSGVWPVGKPALPANVWKRQICGLVSLMMIDLQLFFLLSSRSKIISPKITVDDPTTGGYWPRLRFSLVHYPLDFCYCGVRFFFQFFFLWVYSGQRVHYIILCCVYMFIRRMNLSSSGQEQ